MRLLGLTFIVLAFAGCLQEPAPSEGRGFDGGTAWIQGGPLSMDDLEGNVVLVDFWTYSCINCIRTLPHLTAWYDTYADHGLVIVGVHSPEFDFEKDAGNVQAAIDRHGIHYPVVLDNDFNIWRDWEQRYWPAKYLLDQDGQEVYRHFGEGAYQETEQTIRDLLAADGTALPPPVESGADNAPPVTLSPEMYAGTWRDDQSLGNPQGYRPGQAVDYVLPDERRVDRFYLDGTWFNGEEAMEAQEDATLVLHFRAAAANFVAQGTGCVQVSMDGEAIPEQHRGRDLAADGCIHLDGSRSYDFWAGDYGQYEVRFDVPEGFLLYTFAFSRSVQGTQ